MKKSILQFSVIAAIAASMTLTTSCSSDDSAEVYVLEPVVFKAGVGQMAVTRSADWETNKYTIADKWGPNNVLVNIYTTTDKNQSNSITLTYKAASADALTTTLSPNSTDADKCFYWATGTEEKEVRAWSLGTTSSSDLSNYAATISFEVPHGSNPQTNKELLYCYQKYARGGTLTFKHQLAKVVVKVWTRQAKGDIALTLGNSANKIQVQNTFNEPTALGGNGTWDVLSHPADANSDYITPQVANTPNSDTDGTNSDYKAAAETSEATDANYGYVTIYEAVVLPGSYSGKKLFVVTYDGTTFMYTGVADDSFDPGKVYTYNIKITDAAIETANATITAWSSQTAKNGSATLQ